jgi:tight adherence protein C
MDIQTLFILCVVGSVSLVVYFAARMLIGNDELKLRDRLESDNRTEAPSEQPKNVIRPLIQKVGHAAAEPFMPKTREKQSEIRRKLGYAGIYSPGAFRLMTGAKVILLGLGLIGGYVVGLWTDYMMMSLSLGGLIGYLGPTMWLKKKIQDNQQALNHGIPDALDLMVVCVEAGLTIDAAMQRVGLELALAHPAVSREFGIAHMETRVGLSRAEALKNLGVRTGSAALKSLAAMLVQADRFGTSIATALRVHAETLRGQRQMAAEEMAAKASVKMSFPLVLFIFPATFIVLAGPTIIQLMNSELMK